VNIVETHHKVFPILGEASSPSKKNAPAERPDESMWHSKEQLKTAESDRD